MNPHLLTLSFALTGFIDRAVDTFGDTKGMTPDQVTRFAIDPDFKEIEVSNQHGPQDDGRLELIDAIDVPVNLIPADVNIAKAIVVRMQSFRGLDSIKATRLGKTVTTYMEKSGTTQFATAAIDSLSKGQVLRGKWNTLLLIQDKAGNWTFKNLRFLSVQPSVDGKYALLLDGKINTVTGIELVTTLIDDGKINTVLTNGYDLDKGKYHLVRAPINTRGAFAIVGKSYQYVRDIDFKVIAAAKTGMTVIPAIDVDGSVIKTVTTVDGKDNDWTVLPQISVDQIPTDLRPAYQAAA